MGLNNPSQGQIIQSSVFEPIKKWRDDFSGNALSNAWEVLSLGSGQSINVSNSELRVRANVTANAQTVIRSTKSFTLPCRVFFIYTLTQRIANQAFHLEIVDFTGDNRARFTLNGTSNTNVLCELANNGNNGASGTINTLASSSYTFLELDIGIDELKFVSRNVEVTSARNAILTRHRKLPDPNVEYFIQIRAVNASIAPTSSTDLLLDSVSYQSYELINADINASRGSVASGDSLPVTVVSQPSLSGNLSIIDGGDFNALTSNNLAANATYTSISTGVIGRNSLTVTVVTNQSGQLYIEQGVDGNSWLDYGVRNCVSGVNTFNVNLDLSRFRIRCVNGSTATGVFAIYTKTRT